MHAPITSTQLPRLGTWVWIPGIPGIPGERGHGPRPRLGRVTDHTHWTEAGETLHLLQVRTLAERNHRLPVAHAGWYWPEELIRAA